LSCVFACVRACVRACVSKCWLVLQRACIQWELRRARRPGPPMLWLSHTTHPDCLLERTGQVAVSCCPERDTQSQTIQNKRTAQRVDEQAANQVNEVAVWWLSYRPQPPPRPWGCRRLQGPSTRPTSQIRTLIGEIAWTRAQYQGGHAHTRAHAPGPPMCCTHFSLPLTSYDDNACVRDKKHQSQRRQAPE
jgi:hypothetical protein